MEMENLKELNQIASQVAHDIRSPLSALTMLAGSLNEVSEEKRVLLRSATQRINDIANNLLWKSQKKKNTVISEKFALAVKEEPVKPSVELIPAIVDLVISEKRMQYRNCAGLEIELDLSYGFASFSKVNGSELQRVMSNLINNSVEAIDNQKGKITITVEELLIDTRKKVKVTVTDNGKGIPRHILEKLGHLGVTYGKKGTESGSGIGIYHAKKTIESLGGEVLIESTEGRGTTISMFLPLAEPPSWFAQEIKLKEKKYIVSLDDDASIHQIWVQRFKDLEKTGVKHLEFQSGDAFEKYVNENIKRLKDSIFLIDYELLNQSKTGLQIIEDLMIEKYCILVTSRYEDKVILERATKLHLKILPKALSGFVPIIREP